MSRRLAPAEVKRFEELAGGYAVGVHAKLQMLPRPSNERERLTREHTAEAYLRSARHHFSVGKPENAKVARELAVAALASYMIAGVPDDKIKSLRHQLPP